MGAVFEEMIIILTIASTTLFMKRYLLPKFAVLASLNIALLSSCDKDNDEDQSLAQRILGVWNIVTETESFYDEGTETFTNPNETNIAPGDFTAEFRNDGKLYMMLDQLTVTYDTLNYQVQGDTVILVNGEKFFIESFSNSHMITTDYYHDGTDSVMHVLEYTR